MTGSLFTYIRIDGAAIEFRWNEWNLEHGPAHGVTPAEAEQVVRNARRPFPRVIDGDKRLVWGRGYGGGLIQVVFALDETGAIYILHARPLSEGEKKRFRKRAES